MIVCIAFGSKSSKYKRERAAQANEKGLNTGATQYSEP
jgi:hypothetical protein